MEIIKAGTKIVFRAHAGMAGTDACEFFVLTHDMTEEALSDEAWQFGKQHAEMYGIYPEYEYSEEEVAEDPESYSDGIEGWYELYDAKEHDGKSMDGNPHFQEM